MAVGHRGEGGRWAHIALARPGHGQRERLVAAVAAVAPPRLPAAPGRETLWLRPCSGEGTAAATHRQHRQRRGPISHTSQD